MFTATLLWDEVSMMTHRKMNEKYRREVGGTHSTTFNEGKRIERLGDPKISISPNYNIAA